MMPIWLLPEAIMRMVLQSSSQDHEVYNGEKNQGLATLKSGNAHVFVQ